MGRSSSAMVVALILAGAWTPGGAAAEESELRLMAEPTSYTDVVDAFDEGDPFDLHVHLGFRRLLERGDVQREVSDTSPAAGAMGSAAFRDVAEYQHIRNTLELGLDVGLYQDLALYARLPVVLSDTRDLLLPESRSNVAEDLRAVRGDPSSAPLFDVPFDSPTRSGLDYLGIGLAWAIFNQHRTPDVPTWVLMAEGRFNVSPEMHACQDAAGGRRCLEQLSDGSLGLVDGGEPGVGRGTNGLRIETRTSRRYRYVEPYMGIAFQIEWPGRAEDFFQPGGDLDGFMNTLPPRIGELTAGLTVVPWEHRGRWQRLALDVRVVGTWFSEGRDYSPLFDPLGSSASPHLTEPNSEGVPNGTASLRKVEFNGLTDVQAHGRIGGRFALEMQAARYVWFGFGVGLFYDTPYLLTFADACDPDADRSGNEDPRIGRCRSGIINPHHRPVVDLPGSRFRLDGALIVDIFATAVAQF